MYGIPGKLMFSLVLSVHGGEGGYVLSRSWLGGGRVHHVLVLPGGGEGEEGTLTRGLIGVGEGRRRYPNQMTLLPSAAFSLLTMRSAFPENSTRFWSKVKLLSNSILPI